MKKNVFFLAVVLLLSSCLNQNRDIRQRWLEFSELDEEQQLAYWIEDLHYFADKLEKKHENPFTLIRPEVFYDEIAQAEIAFSGMNNTRRFGELQKITASIKDGHCRLESSFSIHEFPFRIAAFQEGYFIVSTDKQFQDLLGFQVLMIGSSPVGNLLESMEPFISASNSVEKKLRTIENLSNGEMMYLAGIIESPDRAVFTFQSPEGESVTRLITASPEYHSGDSWYAHNTPGNDRIYLTGQLLPYRLDYLDDEKLILFQYNQCSEFDSYPMEEVVKQIRDWETEKNASYLMIDLRYNQGGDSRVLKPLIQYLSEESTLNRRGHLFTAIGRKTYSSAIINALQLEQQTQAIYIGEATSGKPNHFGEVRSFMLPNTAIRVHYSSKFFKNRTRDTETLEPQIPVSYRFEDYRQGIDPILQLIREQTAEE